VCLGSKNVCLKLLFKNISFSYWSETFWSGQFCSNLKLLKKYHILAKSPKIKAYNSIPNLYFRQSGLTYSVEILSVLVIPVKIWNKNKKKAKILWKIFMLNFYKFRHYFCHNFSAERPFCIIFSPIDVTFYFLFYSTVYDLFGLDKVKVFPNLGIRPWPMLFNLDPEFEDFSKIFFHILKLDTWLYKYMKFHKKRMTFSMKII
jgi:hypothetical protein